MIIPASAWALALAISFLLYEREHALVHFAWHVGYGSAFGLLLAALVCWWRQRPVAFPSLWALGGYAFMAIPDLLWLAPTLAGRPPWPHAPWMDLFLGHVSLDAWPWASHALLPVLLATVAIWWVSHRQVAGRHAADPSDPQLQS